jgi:hypothetical protein
MKTNSNFSDQAVAEKVYINPADDDLYVTSDAALEAPVEYIVIS